jgi:RNA polymerase sigma-54 factor
MAAIRTGLTQTLRLNLNQSLIQGLQILQMPLHELEARIRREIQENPFVDEAPRKLKADKGGMGTAPESYPQSKQAPPGITYTGTGDYSLLDNAAAAAGSFKDRLIEQAAIPAADESELSLYREVIYMLDNRGFFTGDAAALALDLNTSTEHINSILAGIREFEPDGCGLPGVREYLIYQAENTEGADPLVKEILENLFSELEKFDYEKIARKLKVDMERVIICSEQIRRLRPYPSYGHFSDEKSYISADIEAFVKDGELFIKINDELLPEIVINSFHREILRKKNIEKKEKNYIQDKKGSARALVSAIASRNETLKRVAVDIMERQKKFLVNGPGTLVPMTMKEVAERLSIDISTVSRAVSGKYVGTPWGLIGLKNFFSPGSAGSADGSGDISADGLMKRIREIIEEEPHDSPRTDAEIAEDLVMEGIKSARRTISKYRDLMGIPTSNIRKKINRIKKLKGTI